MQVSQLLARIIRKALAVAARVEAVITGYLFDRVEGVETCKTLDRFALDVEASLRAHAWSYEPCSYPRFRRVMKVLPELPERLTFVDIGSGKGRQVIAAALHGFPRAIGVELSPTLHAAAQRNVASFLRHEGGRARITLENMEATQFVLPSEACLLFLFNPFQEPVVRKFLAALTIQVSGRSQPLYIAYVHPTVRQAFEEANLFEVVASLPWPTDAVIYRLRLPRP